MVHLIFGFISSTVLGLSWRTFRGMPQQGLPNWCEGASSNHQPDEESVAQARWFVAKNKQLRIVAPHTLAY